MKIKNMLGLVLGFTFATSVIANDLLDRLDNMPDLEAQAKQKADAIRTASATQQPTDSQFNFQPIDLDTNNLNKIEVEGFGFKPRTMEEQVRDGLANDPRFKVPEAPKLEFIEAGGPTPEEPAQTRSLQAPAPKADAKAEAQASQPQQPEQQAPTQNASTGNYYQRTCRSIIHKEGDKKLVLTEEDFKDHDKKTCKSLYIVSQKITNEDPETEPSTYSTMDKRVTCIQKAGYTADFEKCKKMAKLYNYVVGADQALQLAQAAQTQQESQDLQRETELRAQQGDLQAASFDAMKKSNDNLKEKQNQLAAAYMSAVTGFSGSLATWPNAKSLKKDCGTDTSCQLAVDNASKSNLFSNDEAKGTFIAIAAEFGGKAARAAMMAKQLEDMNGIMAQQTPPPPVNDVMIEHCALYPTDPACAAGPGQRVQGQTFQSGSFTVGDGSGNNAFNMGEGTDTAFGDPGAAGSSGQKIADINSPFLDQAKEASGILNPAPAANVQPGGGAGGGGGGGAGGGLGGGGVSLGDDLQGEDSGEKKDPTIKANKISSNGAAGGGKGFGKLAQGKEDANPFSNLFDAKSSGGGIEEDRSIASDDGTAASGLFQKISRRYTQIQADKRLEANNLE